MLIQLFLKGILIGFIGSMPVGPISVLIIHRTINNSRRAGFLSGIGAAFSDTSYFGFAAFSLTFIIGFIRQQELLFKIFGAIVLVLLGVFILFSNPHVKKTGLDQQKKSAGKLIFSTFLLTITNPFILFGYIGFFAGTGLLENISSDWHPLFLIAGFLAGGCGWWFTLSGIINHLHGRFNFRSLKTFNKITGSTIILLVILSLCIYFFRH